MTSVLLLDACLSGPAARRLTSVFLCEVKIRINLQTIITNKKVADFE